METGYEVSEAQQEAVHAEQQIKSLQDINERLQEYNTSSQQCNSKPQNDSAINSETVSRLEKEKTTMTEALSSSSAHCSLLQEPLAFSRDIISFEELKSIAEQLREEERHITKGCNLQLANVPSLTSFLTTFTNFRREFVIGLANSKKAAEHIVATGSSQRDHIQMLEEQLLAANNKLQLAVSEHEEQEKTIRELQDCLSEANLKISKDEMLRKELHNTIVELKGNIRVFCRVRPLQPDVDDSGIETSAVSYPSALECLGRGIELAHSGQKYPFTFDKVFDHKATQEDVFVEISQLVQSALDGYKVCIFAYGQTGSGKTYTMMGKPEASEQKGLIPRSLEQIFQNSQSLSSQGWKYKMQASVLEIYNETIRDLLSANRSSCLDANAAVGKQYTIKHDQNGNTTVTDLTVVDVWSIKEASYLLNQAAQSRSVGGTQMNEQSSRSHFIFTLRISGVNEGTEQQVQGVLNFIDLAGSVRLARSGAIGDRLKETRSINKSLSALSGIISSIARKEDNVPFRNSKLTHLLQPCLGGDSKTLMFVNISPESPSTAESLCSLRFAARVNASKIWVPLQL